MDRFSQASRLVCVSSGNFVVFVFFAQFCILHFVFLRISDNVLAFVFVFVIFAFLHNVFVKDCRKFSGFRIFLHRFAFVHFVFLIISENFVVFDASGRSLEHFGVVAVVT